MTIEVAADQAPVQSVEERLAAQFMPNEESGEGSTTAPDGETGEVAAPDLWDLELDGETYRLPAKLKDGFMQHADYTKKTQEIAEQRRTLDHSRSLAEQGRLNAEFQESISAESRQLAVIDAYLAQAGKVDWSNMSTDQMFRSRMELDGIKEQRAELQRSITDKHTKFQSAREAALKDLKGKARELASKSIKDFSEDTEKAMRGFLRDSQGLTDTEIDAVFLDPRSQTLVWKAMQFDKIQTKAIATPQGNDKIVRPGAAENRMPKEVATKLNFRKAMNKATTSRDKASLIEERLASIFQGA